MSAVGKYIVDPPQCSVTGEMHTFSSTALGSQCPSVLWMNEAAGEVWCLVPSTNKSNKAQSTESHLVHLAVVNLDDVVQSHEKDGADNVKPLGRVEEDERWTSVYTVEGRVLAGYFASKEDQDREDSARDVFWLVSGEGIIAVLDVDTKALLTHIDLQVCISSAIVLPWGEKGKATNEKATSGLLVSAYNGALSEILQIGLEIHQQSSSLNISASKKVKRPSAELGVVGITRIQDQVEQLAIHSQSLLASISRGGNIDFWDFVGKVDRTESYGSLRLDAEKHGPPCCSVFVSTPHHLQGHEALWVGMSDGCILVISPIITESTTPQRGKQKQEWIVPKVQPLEYHQRGTPITCLVEMGLGTNVWSCSLDGQIVVWNIDTLLPSGVFDTHHQRTPLQKLLVSSQTINTSMVSMDVEGRAVLWDVRETLRQRRPVDKADVFPLLPPTVLQQKLMAYAVDCCGILRRGSNQAPEDNLAAPPQELVDAAPEAVYLQDALLCIADCTTMLTNAMRALDLEPTSLNEDCQKICSFTSKDAPRPPPQPQQQPRLEKRISATAEKLESLSDDLFPVPESVKDPSERLLTLVDCVIEQVEATGYLTKRGFDLASIYPPNKPSTKEEDAKKGNMPASTPTPRQKLFLNDEMDESPETNSKAELVQMVDDLHEQVYKLESEVASVRAAWADQVKAARQASEKAKNCHLKNEELTLQLEERKEEEEKRIESYEQQLGNAKKALATLKSENHRLEVELLQAQTETQRLKVEQQSNREDESSQLEKLMKSKEKLQSQNRAMQQELQRSEKGRETAEKEKEILESTLFTLRKQLQSAEAMVADQGNQMKRMSYEQQRVMMHEVNNSRVSKLDHSDEHERLQEELEAKNSIVQELLQIVKDNASVIDDLKNRNNQRKQENVELRKERAALTDTICALQKVVTASATPNRAGGKQALGQAGVNTPRVTHQLGGGRFGKSDRFTSFSPE